MTRVSRLLPTLVVSSIAWATWANAAPAMSGVYHVGSAGLIEFGVQNNEVVGRYRAGGECGFAPDDLVVRGSFDGNVFVGQVTLCQTGSGCPATQSFPMLGFWRGDQMLAQIKFEAGCSSKATDNAQLLFTPATAEDKKLLETTPVAPKKPRSIDDAYREGSKLLSSGDYSRARLQFDFVVNTDSSNWVGWWGLGRTLVGLKEFQMGSEDLERAFRQAPPGANKELLWQASFDLGVAYAQLGKKGPAMKALREAARMMPADQLGAFESEPDLKPIRGERDFQALVASLKKGKKGK